VSRKQKIPPAAAGAKPHTGTPATRPKTPPEPRAPNGGRPGAPPEGPQSNASDAPPAGLDADRHAAAQRTAHQAELLREGVFPALMASAIALDKFFDAGAFRVYLARVLADLGNPADPIERMLVEQLCMAHFRVAQLHAGAGQAVGLEATKLLNTVVARMLGEMRRTALSLKAYRTTAVPTSRGKAHLKLVKAAQ
jgi:hypothetical protein